MTIFLVFLSSSHLSYFFPSFPILSHLFPFFPIFANFCQSFPIFSNFHYFSHLFLSFSIFQLPFNFQHFQGMPGFVFEHLGPLPSVRAGGILMYLSFISFHFQGKIDFEEFMTVMQKMLRDRPRRPSVCAFRRHAFRRRLPALRAEKILG